MKVGGGIYGVGERVKHQLCLLSGFLILFSFFGDRYYYYVVNALFLSIPLSLSDLFCIIKAPYDFFFFLFYFALLEKL